MEKRIIVLTGNVYDAIGPNDRGNNGVNHYFDGDPDLEKLASGKTKPNTALNMRNFNSEPGVSQIESL